MIIVEDGTGIEAANSYESVASFDAFHALRQNTEAASATVPAKEAALVRATDYIEAHARAAGAPSSPTQGLQWPVEGSAALPRQVRAATLLLALYALRGPLITPATRGIKSKTVKAGKVETATVYDDASPSDPYPEITAMLAPVVAQPVSGASVSFSTVIR
jgi:hypothetical protein